MKVLRAARVRRALMVATVLLASCGSRAHGGPGTTAAPASKLTAVQAAVAYCAGGAGTPESFVASAVKQGLLTDGDAQTALQIVRQQQAASLCQPRSR